MRPLEDMPPSQMKDLLGLEEMDLPSCAPMATSPQASPGNTTQRDSSAIIQVSHSPSPATASKSQGAASTPSDYEPQAQARAGQFNIPQEVAWLQRTWMWPWGSYWLETALDSHQRELEWDLDSAMQQCEGQTAKAIQEVESLCTAAIEEAETCHVVTIKRQKTATLIKPMPFNSHTERAF